jgi:hypothetical protein
MYMCTIFPKLGDELIPKGEVMLRFTPVTSSYITIVRNAAALLRESV